MSGTGPYNAGMGEGAYTVTVARDLQDLIPTFMKNRRKELEALRATWANANARVELARRALEAARVMANAERERLELGQSSILQVNLREEAERNAELSELDALLSYHLARAQYQSALGRSEIRDYLPFAAK